MRRIPLLLLPLVVGCAGGGPRQMQITLTLPDDTARLQTAAIELAAVIPGPGANCQDLLEGQARPNDEAYPVERKVEFDYPADEIPLLQQVGPGRRLFFVEASNRYQVAILRGCREADSGSELVLELAWIPGCTKTNDGSEACDGIDNDCDGQTDEDEPAGMCGERPGSRVVSCSDGRCIRGCRPGYFNPDGDWDNGCECHLSRDGEEYCDGVDNDCDGVTDGDGCRHCSQDSDCVEDNGCLTGTCSGGVCHSSWLPDGTACNDGDACTSGDTCQGGICSGSLKDCDDGLACTVDLCLPDGSCSNDISAGFCLIDGACYSNGQRSPDSYCRRCDTSQSNTTWTLEAEGTSCDDGLWCTGTDVCSGSGGECRHENPPCTEMCLGNCSEEEHTCLPDAEGTPCDDGFLCTGDDACDGAGSCRGTPSADYCGSGEECAPACAADESGCVTRPDWLEMNCPGEAGAGEEAACSLVVHGAEGTEACLSCRVELVPSIVESQDFATDNSCDLGNWVQEPSNCDADDSYSCPFTPGGDGKACCDRLDCHAVSGLLFFPAGCLGTGWRLAQVFELNDFTAARLCYRLGHPPGTLEGSFAVVGDRNDDSAAVEIACEGGESWFFVETQPCVDLPPVMLDWQQTRLTLWAQASSNDGFHLGRVDLYAFPGECPGRETVFQTVFDVCGENVTEFEEWQLTPSGSCIDGSVCGHQGGLLLGQYGELTARDYTVSRKMDLVDRRPPAQLCWTYSLSPGFMGNFSVLIGSDSVGAWRVPLYDFDQAPGALSPICGRRCIDLSSPGEIFGNDQVSVYFELRDGNGFMLIHDITLEASRPCDAGGVFTVSPVQPDGAGGHRVLVNDVAGKSRRARVTCDWNRGEVSQTREIEFRGN